MILETVRIVADWLANGTFGVNAVRTSVPKDTGVTDFPAVQIFDSTRDGRIGRGGIPQMLPTELPALLVTPADSPLEQTNPASRPFPPDATVTVLVRYVTRGLDTALAERHTSQTIKAVWWQLPQLMLTSAGETARTRAQVQLYGITNMQAATLYEAAEDTTVSGGVLVTCRVRYMGPT
jgi:hypothetical protein